KRTDKFRSEVTGLEGKRITFRIRQDVLKKTPYTITDRLKIYYALAQTLDLQHPFMRFIITLVGVKKSTQEKHTFGISTPNQGRTPRDLEELWKALEDELWKFYNEESPDWEYLTATRFIIRYSKRIDDETD
ncbi:hypothetical protein, partial [Candidatus Magnetobacterium casense]